MRHLGFAGVMLGVWALGALAHEGVRNPGVMARMDAMKDVGAATKVLGEMVKGATAFDVVVAQAAARTIAERAQATPALFEEAHNDPKSEALPAIWKDFEDFSQRAQAMEAAANALAVVQGPEGLRAGLGLLGETCKGCHESYRK